VYVYICVCMDVYVCVYVCMYVCMLQQEQESLAYEFRLAKEKSEAERKRIQAEGEAKANKIINSSLTPSLLKMRGIEATLELAKSPNSKVVIVGSGKDGLPLILGGK